MKLRTTQIKYINLHHTAGHEKNTQAVRQEHINQGWGDIGYNAVIEPNGTVGIGRDIKYSGAHNLGLSPDGSGYTMNQKAYAISHIGNFMEDIMSDIQFWPSVKFCTQKCKELGLIPSIDTIRPHKADYSTDCPGDQFPYERYVSEVIKLFNGGSSTYMKNLVAYFGDGDRDIAIDFANYMGCPVILASQVTSELSKAVSGQKYQVGGGSAPTGFKLLAGSDRFATKIAVLKEMGRI